MAGLPATHGAALMFSHQAPGQDAYVLPSFLQRVAGVEGRWRKHRFPLRPQVSLPLLCKCIANFSSLLLPFRAVVSRLPFDVVVTILVAKVFVSIEKVLWSA